MRTSGGAWGTKLGFYLAAIGSAFGLGNLWRFPYVVAENGGGAFVLLYMVLVFVCGMPLLVGELLLGKSTRTSVVSAMSHLKTQAATKKTHLNLIDQLLPSIGKLAVLVSMIVLAYYAVISGWVLHFLMQFLVGFLSPDGVDPKESLQVLLDKGWLQVLLTSVHLLLVGIVVAKDVEEGIERWVGYMMPVFVVLLCVLAIRALSMESSSEALRFLLYPDFSKLTTSSLGQALGHTFFTLSIGFGTMVTFGSYFQESSYVPLAGFRVASYDSIISLFAGVLIFPLVLASPNPEVGPELLFQTVPLLFGEIRGGSLFGVGFFLCLYLATLGASIGLLETIVANLRERHKLKRNVAAPFACLLCFVFALFPALSSSVFQGVRIGESGLLETLDAILINWILPIVALVISQVVYYRLADAVKKQEFMDPSSPGGVKLYSHWCFALRWVIPPLIVTALILQAIPLFKN